jgi:magnesium-transporting ATPase (P-type)
MPCKEVADPPVARSHRPIKISKNFEDELIRLMAVAGLVSLVLGVITEGFKWGWIEGMSIFFAVALVIFLSSINDYAHEKSFQLIKGKLGLRLIRVYRGGRLYLIDPK